MKSDRAVYTFADLQNWRACTRAIAPPIRLAVLGDPVAHSASPPMHNAALAAHNIDCSYVRLHILPSQLHQAIPLLLENQFVGVNLTIPHKAAVLPLADHLDPSAKRLGVANTLVFRNNQSRAHNTDGLGLVRAIQSDFHKNLGSLRPLVLGAGGGAGRAIAIQCALEGCPHITLVNRTLEKAEALAAELQQMIQSLSLPSPPRITTIHPSSQAIRKAVADSELLLQCTSLGMNENDPSPLPSNFISPQHLVYDTIYSRPTALLREAKALGAKTSNGLSMLLHQGALAFEIWFPDKLAPLTKMHSALTSALYH